jgi:hypothetical protein
MNTSFLRKDNPPSGTAQGNGPSKISAVPCYQAKHTAGFSEILQRLPGERKAIAADLGVSYSTYSNWVYGLQSFPPDLIPRLFAVTGSVDILEFLLDPCGLMPVPKAKAGRHILQSSSADIFRHLMDATESLAKAHAAYKIAIKDGHVDEKEAARIFYFLNEAQREEASIEEDVRAEAGK